MLQIVTRCKELGGGVFAGSKNKSAIDIAEDNLRRLQARSKETKKLIEQLTEQEEALVKTRDGILHPDALKLRDEKILQIRREKLREEAELALWHQRETAEAENLKKMYIDFVEAYDSLSIFLNLRRGTIHSEEVRAFDLPDSLVPSANEVQVWKDFYDRALYNSTHELVINETKAFFQAKAGATRTFVRDMNKLTGQFFGKKFTESELGNEFLKYNRHIATEVTIRIGKFLGITVPATLGTYYGDKLWENLFVDEQEEIKKKEEKEREARKAAIQRRRAERERRLGIIEYGTTDALTDSESSTPGGTLSPTESDDTNRSSENNGSDASYDNLPETTSTPASGELNVPPPFRRTGTGRTIEVPQK